MYGDILMPTDGSEGAEHAVDQALDIAEKYGATLHVLYVVDSSVASYPAEYDMERIMDYLEEGGKEAVDRIAERGRENGLEVVKKVKNGVPHKEILKYTENNEVDLVVMGSHGRSGIERLLLGSVTEKVVRKSDTPVLVAKLKNSETKISDPQSAQEHAEKTMKGEGHEEYTVTDTYRGASTWIVVFETPDANYNVHIDPRTGEVKVAKVKSDQK